MSSNRDSKSCHADDFPNERPLSENCMQRRSRVRRKSTNLSSRVSIESEQALEAQREILTYEAAEEIHRRDNKSLRMSKTLKFELRCQNLESSVRREGSRQTREYLQRNINSSNEECRKCVNLYKAFQNERASLVPDVRRLQSLLTVDLRSLRRSIPRDGTQRSATESRKPNCETEFGSAKC